MARSSQGPAIDVDGPSADELLRQQLQGNDEQTKPSSSSERAKRGRSEAKRGRSEAKKKKASSSSSSPSRRSKKKKKSLSRSKRPRRRSSSKRTSRRKRSHTPPPSKKRSADSPVKDLQELGPEEQVRKIATSILAFLPASNEAERNEVAAACVDAGISCLSDFKLFRESEDLVTKILPEATLRVQMLLRRVISEGRGAPGTGLAITETSSDAHMKLAEAVSRMAKDNSSRARRNDGVRRGLPSDDEDEPVFDLGKALLYYHVEKLPVDWFGEPKRLEVLRRLFEKGKASGKPWPHFVASSPFEDWIPSWTGAGLSPFDRAAALRSWRTRVDLQKPSHASSMILTFWLSHAAVGIIDFVDVFAHMLVFTKMDSEEGLHFAIQHERRLVDYCQLQLKASRPFDLGQLLMAPCPPIVNELRHLAHHTPKNPPSVPQEKGKKPLPLENGPKGGGKAKAPGAPAKGAGKGDKPPPASPPAKRLPICFQHDPASDKVCAARPTCPNEHLDTKTVEGADRFARALKAFGSRPLLSRTR
jgi:hypothetical protein